MPPSVSAERLEDRRELLHRLLVGPLQRLAEPVDRVARQRRDDDREQQQLPAHLGGDRQADDHLHGFQQRLAEHALHALAARESRSDVQRFIKSPRPASVKFAMSSRSTWR